MSAESSTLDPTAKASSLPLGRKMVGHVLVLTCECVALWFGLVWVGVEAVRAYDDSLQPAWVWQGVTVEGVDLSGQNPVQVSATIDAVAQQRLAVGVEVHSAGHRRQLSVSELGLVVQRNAAQREALELGRSAMVFADLRVRRELREEGHTVALRAEFDEAKALLALEKYADEFSTPQIPARVDFVGRKVEPAQPAQTLSTYAAVMALADGLMRGQTSIELEAYPVPGRSARQTPLVAADLAVTISAFETSFSTDASTRDRVHNLRIAAQALDGTVIAPGTVFSFNERVGERSFEVGYRQAPGINAGELVDVVGGGVCQVASTLFAAAFMGGLDIVRALPHSRPSNYIELGLDTTVVWPTLDLQIRNSYSFPVVIHTVVQRGKVRVEMLAREAGAKVEFQRTISGEAPFARSERSDSALTNGATEIKQRGHNGYFVTRWRHIHRAGESTPSVERWDLTYPPTEEIVVHGTAAKGRPAGLPPPAKASPEVAVKITNDGGQASDALKSNG